MLFTRNKIAIGNTYKAEFTYEFSENDPVWKLTIATDAIIRVQLSEFYPVKFENPQDTEIELDPGTHSLTFVVEKFGFRIKAAGSSATVSLRAEGPGS